MKNFLKKSFGYIDKLGMRLRRHNLSEYSAYSALYIMLSFAPFLIILLNILKSLPIFNNAPDYELMGSGDMTDFLRQLMTEIDAKATGAVISISTIITLWSAARGLIGIINGLNRIHHAKETRGYLRVRTYSLGYTFLLMVVIILTAVVLVFGEFLMNTAESLLGIPEMDEFFSFTTRWIVIFIILSVFFVLIYSVLPIKKSKPFKKIPGAIFTAAGWIGFSALYSVYVNHFADFSGLYGSLGVFVLPIIWLYICMYILFLGEEINVMLEKGYLKTAFNDIFLNRKPPIKPEKINNKTVKK